MKSKPAPKPAPKPAAQAASAVAPGDWRLWLLLAAVAVVAYANSLGLGLAMDAPLLIRDPRVQAFTSENVDRILHEPYWWGNLYSGLYRPVTTFSFLLNFAMLGNRENPAGYHFLNLLLHLGCACMVFALARRIAPGRWTAWLAAALWAVHPVGSETVTNVAGRADLLAAAATLGGLLWYAHRVRERDRAPFRTATVLFLIAAAGVFAKESAAVLPGLLLLWDMTYGPGLREWRRRVPAYAATLLAVAAFFAVRQQMPRMHVPLLDNAEVGAGFLDARLTALTVIARYLGLLVWPLRLSSDYSYNQIPVVGAGDAAGWLAAALVGGLLAAAILRRRRDPALFFAAGFFGLALLPASNLAVLIGSIMAERFVYLAAAGFTLAVAVLGGRAIDRYARGSERGVAIAVAAALALLALRTASRNTDWKDDATLWAANLQTAPLSYKAHKGMATALFDLDPQRNLDQATRHLETAWSLVRGAPAVELPENVMTDLGVCYRLLGDRAGGAATEGGRSWYQKSVEILERARETDRLADRRVAAGERARGAAVRKVYGMPDLYMNLGNVYLNLGETDKALEACRYGRLVEPRNPNFYIAVASVQTARKDGQAAAITLLEQNLAGAADPDNEVRLQSLYKELPGGECAFTGTGRQAKLNYQCPKLKQDVCVAAAGVVKLMAEARRPDDARAIVRASASRFGCEAGPLEAAVK